MRYCSWFEYSWLSSTLQSSHSSTPLTSTGGGRFIYCPSRGSFTAGSKCLRAWSWWFLIHASSSNSLAYVDILRITVTWFNDFHCRFWTDLEVQMHRADTHTWFCSGIFRTVIRLQFASMFCSVWLPLISTQRLSWFWCIVVWSWLSSRRWWCHTSVGSLQNDIWGSLPWTTKNEVHCVDSDVPSFTPNSATGCHFTHISCWWFANTWRYYSMSGFIHSIWSSVFRWYAVYILWSIPRCWHIRPQDVEANWGPKSKTIISGNLWRHTTSCNDSSGNSEPSISSWDGTKCHIFESSNSLHFGSRTTILIKQSSHGSFGMGRDRRASNG